MATQTQVLIAHTGQRLQVDSSQFDRWVSDRVQNPPLPSQLCLKPQQGLTQGCLLTGPSISLDDFKTWVAFKSAIPAQNVVALTSQGKTARIKIMQSEVSLHVTAHGVPWGSDTEAASSCPERDICI